MSAKITKPLKPAAWLFYLIIGIEILYMISPFAIYYYSTYGPSLNFLHNSPWTAWLTGFFLPHYVKTSSFILNGLDTVGAILVVGGLLFFLIGAGQIYYYKFTKRGAVTGGLYEIIRHPQYLALALLGFGLLLVWPRFTVLVMYVTMLFVYFWLARKEEKECEAKYGESYGAYRARTSMVFPLRLSILKRLPALPGSGPARSVAICMVYLVTLGVSIAAAFGLRNYSLSRVSVLATKDSVTISAAVMSQEEMRELLEIATRSTEVRRHLARAQNSGSRRFLNYIVPLQWYLPDVPMEELPKGFHGHHQPEPYDRDRYKILITEARLRADKPVQGVQIIKQAYGRVPVVLAKVDRESGKVTGVETPPAHVRWGDIPTPLF